MSGRFQTVLLLFMATLAVTLGAGAVLVLGTSLQAHAAELMPIVVMLSVFASGASAMLGAAMLGTRFEANYGAGRRIAI